MFEVIAGFQRRAVLISSVATLFVAAACSHATHKSDDPPAALAVEQPLPTPEPGFSPGDVGLNDQEKLTAPPAKATKVKHSKKVAQLHKKRRPVARITKKNKKIAKSLPVAMASIEKPLPPPPAPPAPTEIAPLIAPTESVSSNSGPGFWVWIAGGLFLVGAAAYTIRRRNRRLPGRSRRQGKLIFNP